MQAEIEIGGEGGAGTTYVTWAPMRATVRLTEPDGAEEVEILLANADPSRGGQLEFGMARDGPRSATLSLTLGADGSPVEFFLAGEFGRPSSADGDAVIRGSVADEEVAAKAVMVRVRKNADGLTAAERDRFTTALAQLNDQGAGLFRDFRAMHRERLALLQAHGAPGFLSWHRAYLLDLERELQGIDASVTLPYWRFDEPAPNVFTPGFLGRSTGGPLGSVVFDPTNLLRFWQTDQGPGITRRPGFDVLTGTAFVSGQAATLLLGGVRPGAVFDSGSVPGGFDEMEGDPHGLAHTSFDGWIRSPATAPSDPLFFLLHCNVDRLWALWQWFNDRFDGSRPDTYFFRGTAGSSPATRLGHNLRDTMWPWNDETGGERPATAPRTPFPSAAGASGPGAEPTVGDMIDYQGLLDPGSYMGFCYDDVPPGVAP